MRSVCRTCVILLSLAAACGNLSNDDVAFLEALPSKDALHVQVPAQTAQPQCLLGEAQVWLSAKPTSDNINAGVDGILALVDVIRGIAPTTRQADTRTWGPWPDHDHPGLTIRVTMSRTRDASGVPQSYSYVFAESKGGDFLAVLDGTFEGAQAANGRGTLTLHFDNAHTLGTAKPTDPDAPALFAYDLSGNPRTLEMNLTAQAGLGLQQFDYSFAGYTDGHGLFHFAFPDAKGNLFTVTASFTALGAGKAEVGFTTAPPFSFSGSLSECWDAAACLSYVDDPYAITQPACGVFKPCVLGSPASCPSFP